MSGLSNLTFLDGAMRGAEFVNNMEDRKLRREQAQQQEQRAEQSHALQVEGAEQQRQLTGMRIDQINEENAAKMNKTLAWQMHNAKDMPQEYQQLLAAHPNLGASRLMSDEMGSALKTYKKIRAGELDYRSPEAAAVVDVFFPEIKLGAKDGRKVSTRRVLPGQTPGTVVLGLNVNDEPDDKPLTWNRSADPSDPIREVTLDEFDSRYDAISGYRNYLMSPQGREAFIQQTIGDELAKNKYESQKKDLELKKLNYETVNAANKGAQESWGPIQYDEKTGRAFQRKGNGEVKWQPGSLGGAGGAAGGKTTQRQLDYRFAIDQMGMDEDTALEWASSDKTPTERAEAYANRMVQAETQAGSQPDGYAPADSWKAHRQQFMQAYGSYGKELGTPEQQKPQPAPPSLLADPNKQSQKQPGKASKAGGVLMIDANGNRAFVYPDGSHEEVQ